MLRTKLHCKIIVCFLIVQGSARVALADPHFISFDNPNIKHSPQMAPSSEISIKDRLLTYNHSLNTFEFKVSGFFVDSIEIKKINNTHGPFAEISLPGNAILGENGSPQIPVIRSFIKLPNEKTKLKIEIIKQKEILLSDLNITNEIIPYQGPTEKELNASLKKPFYYNNSLYERDEYFPSVNSVELSKPQSVRGHLISLLTIYPIQYNPKKKSIRIITEFKAKIDSDTEAISNDTSEEWNSLLENVVLNFNNPSRDTRSRNGLLIIVAESLMDNKKLKEFINLKQNYGYEIKIEKTSNIGTTANDFREYVQKQYHSWRDQKLSHLLLIGSHPEIPTYKGAGYTDHYYAAIDTHDYKTDVLGTDLFVGRISVNNNLELNTVMDKNIRYSRMTYDASIINKQISFISTTDTGWYKLAEATHQSIIDDITSKRKFRGSFPNHLELGGDRLFGITYKAQTRDVVNSLNSQRSLITYSGHGYHDEWVGPNFRAENFKELVPRKVYPFVASLACKTGEFAESDESFAELWLKHPNGAVGFFGASNLSYWEEDDILERSLFSSLFNESEQNSIAQSIQHGLYSVAQQYGEKGKSQYYFEIYNLLGDPTLRLWTKGPHRLNISAEDVLFREQQEFIVRVMDGINPIVNAVVTLKDIQNKIIFQNRTDNIGRLRSGIDTSKILDSSLNLFIQKSNYEVFSKELYVFSKEKPFVKIISAQHKNNPVDKFNLEAGSINNLYILAKNFGLKTAAGVQILVKTPHPDVKILSPNLFLGDISPGGQNQDLAPILVELSPNILDEEIIPIIFTWEGIESKFYFKASAPRLTIKDLRWQNTGPDKYASPNELVTAELTILNEGHQTVNIQKINLSSLSQIEIIDNEHKVEALAPGEMATLQFKIQVGQNIIDGSLAKIQALAHSLYNNNQIRTDLMMGALILGEESSPIFESNHLKPPKEIPPGDDNGLMDLIDVTQLSSTPLSALSIYLDIEHEYVGDLKIILISPSGREFLIRDEVGGPDGKKKELRSWFDVLPDKSLTLKESKGVWKLKIVDDSERDSGKLFAWKLKLTGFFP